MVKSLIGLIAVPRMPRHEPDVTASNLPQPIQPTREPLAADCLGCDVSRFPKPIPICQRDVEAVLIACVRCRGFQVNVFRWRWFGIVPNRNEAEKESGGTSPQFREPLRRRV